MLRIILNAIELLLYFCSAFFIGKYILDGQTVSNVKNREFKNRFTEFVITHRRAIAGCLLLVPVFTVMFFLTWEQNIFYIMFIMLAEIISLKICMKNLRFLSLASAFFFLFLLDTLVTSYVATIFSFNRDSSRVLEMSVAVVSFACCIIASVTSVRTKIRYLIEWTPMWLKRLLLALLLCCCTLSIILTNHSGSYNPTAHLKILRIVAYTMIFLVIIAMPVLISYSVSNKSMKKRSEEFEKQLRIQLKQYEALSASNQEIRRFRHDYRNMSIGLKKLIEEGRNKEALEMLEQLDKTLDNAMIKYDTGSGIVDALLTDKQNRAEKSNTIIRFEGTIPGDRIEPADLCVIFGNTLDNAIEACGRMNTVEQKLITVNSVYKGGCVVILITNPVDHKIEFSGDIPLTTKKDKKHHGFGLYSLKMVVKRYSGNVTFDCADDKFSVSVDLETSSVKCK